MIQQSNNGTTASPDNQSNSNILEETNIDQDSWTQNNTSQNTVTFDDLESLKTDTLEKLQTITKDMEKNLNTNTMSTFGIFWSILTFLSLQWQIFANICSVHKMIWVSLVTWWLLVLFVLLIKHIFNIKNNKHTNQKTWFKRTRVWIQKKSLRFVSICLIIVGIFLSTAWWDIENICKEESYENLQQYIKDRNKDINDLEKQMNKNLRDYEKKLFELQLQIEKNKSAISNSFKNASYK